MGILIKIADAIDEIINFDPAEEDLDKKPVNRMKQGNEVLEKYYLPTVQREIATTKKNGKTKTLTNKK